MTKFKVGDHIRVINYGSLMLEMENGKLKQTDYMPQLIGKKGIIVEKTKCQGQYEFAIHGISEKYAWYNEDQLELINNLK